LRPFRGTTVYLSEPGHAPGEGEKMNDPLMHLMIYKQQQQELMRQIEINRMLAEAPASRKYGSPALTTRLGSWLKTRVLSFRQVNLNTQPAPVSCANCALGCSCG
jgi:hypothetical protein